MATVTTRVEWAGQHSEETTQIIFKMTEEMTEAGKLISRSSPESSAENTVTAVWSDLDAANEYLAIVNALSPVSAAIV